jgi:hypothetical protein
MDEIRDLIQATRDGNQKKDVMDAINYLVAKNIEEAFPILKDIFFHPLTNHIIRMEVGKIIASTKSAQIYNLLVSHLILKNFSDISAVVYTLGEFKNPDSYETLYREFTTSNFDTQMEIVVAIGKIQSVHALEFFSKVFNGELMPPNLTHEQMQKIKQKAGNALQQQMIDI